MDTYLLEMDWTDETHSKDGRRPAHNNGDFLAKCHNEQPEWQSRAQGVAHAIAVSARGSSP